MDKQLSKKQFFALTASFLLGNTLAVTGGITKGEKIGYITIFISFLLYIALCLIYGGLFEKFGTSDLFYVGECVLGKALYKIFLVIILLYSLFTALVSSAEFLLFVELSSDLTVSPIFAALAFSLCVYCIILCGKRALSGYAELILPFVLFMLAITMLFGIKKFNPANLRIENIPSIKYILSNIALNFISPFSNIMLVYFLTAGTVNHKDIKKQSIKAGFLVLITIAAVYLWNLLIIGKNLMSSLYFPTLYTLGVVNPDLFTERSESIFFVTYIFFDILYTAAAYLTSINCVQRLFFKKNTLSAKTKRILFAIPAILSFAVMNFKTDSESFHSSFINMSFSSASVTLGIPIILSVVSLIRKNHIKPESKTEE